MLERRRGITAGMAQTLVPGGGGGCGGQESNWRWHGCGRENGVDIPVAIAAKNHGLGV